MGLGVIFLARKKEHLSLTPSRTNFQDLKGKIYLLKERSYQIHPSSFLQEPCLRNHSRIFSPPKSIFFFIQRPRYLNARTTLQTLLQTYNAIPIVNENDTVSVSELRFGDNDTLSAITAGLIDADWLFLCTDVDGLYTGNPSSDPNAKRLEVVRDLVGVRELGESTKKRETFIFKVLIRFFLFLIRLFLFFFRFSF